MICLALRLWTPRPTRLVSAAPPGRRPRRAPACGTRREASAAHGGRGAAGVPTLGRNADEKLLSLPEFLNFSHLGQNPNRIPSEHSNPH